MTPRPKKLLDQVRACSARGCRDILTALHQAKPYACPLDVFCLRETRLVNAHRRISLFNHAKAVPKVPLRVYVDVHLVPDETEQLMHVRIWRKVNEPHLVALVKAGIEFTNGEAEMFQVAPEPEELFMPIPWILAADGVPIHNI